MGGDQSEWNTFIFQIFNVVAAIETLTLHWCDMIQYTKERPGTFQIPSNWFFWVQDVNPLTSFLWSQRSRISITASLLAFNFTKSPMLLVPWIQISPTGSFGSRSRSSHLSSFSKTKKQVLSDLIAYKIAGGHYLKFWYNQSQNSSQASPRQPKKLIYHGWFWYGGFRWVRLVLQGLCPNSSPTSATVKEAELPVSFFNWLKVLVVRVHSGPTVSCGTWRSPDSSSSNTFSWQNKNASRSFKSLQPAQGLLVIRRHEIWSTLHIFVVTLTVTLKMLQYWIEEYS